MTNNKTRLVVGVLAGVAAGAAAIYLSDSKNRQIVKQKAKGLQKKGLRVLEQVEEQKLALPAAAAAGAKKVKTLKKKAISKMKAVGESNPLNHRVIQN